METTVNTMKQLPLTFLNVQLPLIPIAKLDSHLSILFGKLSILYDQDLINMVIALLLNKPTSHPDVMTKELKPFLGSQTRVALSVWVQARTLFSACGSFWRRRR